MAADENKTLSVPTFSSFKPKEPASEPKRQGERPKDEAGERDERDRRSRSHHPKHRHCESHRRDRSHREDHRSARGVRGDEPARRRGQEPKPLPNSSSVSSVSGLFVTDTKGDPLIRKYGLDRSKVPQYRRYGGGRVLGTTGRLVVHRDGPRETFSLLLPGEGLAATRGRDGLRSSGWQKREPAKLRPSKRESAEDETEDYISLENPRKRKHVQRDSDSSDSENQPSWRSIEGKAKAVKDTGSDAEDSADSSSELLDAKNDSPLHWKSIQLNRQVKDHPEDIDAWLELANHQDDLLREGETIDQRATESAAHSFAEIKVNMLESALTHASRPEDRQRVLVYLMRQGSKIWSRSTAAKKWSQVLDDERRNFALWKAHLDFSMSSIATVQYEEIKKMFLERLQQVVSRSGLQSREDSEEAISVFLRATRFFHDAGFKEFGVAAWQGLLELNLFRPKSAQSQNEALDSFRDFWESEVPRLGDAGAQGWGHFVDSGGSGEAPEPATNNKVVEADSSRDAYKAWGAAERSRGQQAKMPARTMDDGTDDDPFRVVMYSDIEPWLFTIPADDMPAVASQLVDAFLLFCGLSPAFRTSDWTEAAYHDQFLTGALAGIQLHPAWENAQELQREQTSLGSGNCRARMSPSLLFGGTSWFQYLDISSREHTVDLSWVEKTLKQLVHGADISGLALYYLGVCFAREPAAIKKPAKALLKALPTNAQLFNAYALAELANGNVEVATKVLASAAESPSLSSPSTGFLLFRTWSWLELEKGDKGMATKRLCASVDESLRKPRLDDDVPPAAILRSRQVFSANVHQCLFEGKQEEASGHAECLVLLSYLTGEGGSEPTSASQGNISAAMDVVASMSSEIRTRGHGGAVAHELILQFASRLLYLNAAKGPFRRAYMREQLARFISMFPRNTMFLSLFEWADASVRVVDETRQLVYEKCLVKGQDCVASRLFSIQHELARGNASSTQAAFEHAVRSDESRSSVALWAAYVRFCHSQKQLRARARDVLYRALRHCPWSKEVMMEAFGTLVGDMKTDELRSVYGTMASKGLRIHVDADELMGKS